MLSGGQRQVSFIGAEVVCICTNAIITKESFQQIIYISAHCHRTRNHQRSKNPVSLTIYCVPNIFLLFSRLIAV